MLPACFILLLISISCNIYNVRSTTPGVLPVLPIPTSTQLQWQRRERALFLHFGMNTFTDREWGTGEDSPILFSPSASYNPKQWVSVAKAAGFNLVILTAKHHDGFCLWPSMYTNYSVKSSSWKNGTGDVVKDLVEAAEEVGIQVGLYLSPWDRHEPSYGNTLNYNKYYLSQMRELLTNYGTISEVWLDGAKAENATSMDYKFDEFFAVVRQLQPTASIFSDAGPDARWVGDEQGHAGTTCWSMINISNVQIGHAGDVLAYLNQGDESGNDWAPPECDISIRPGWFWHKNESPKSPLDLLDVYYKSIGRNCVLLLNVPPSPLGLLDDRDVTVLTSFNQFLDSIFSCNLALSTVSFNASSTYSSSCGPEQVLNNDPSTYWAPAENESTGWIELYFEKTASFNVIQIQEAVAFGQRIACHKVDAWSPSTGWYTIAQGTTIGYKKLHRIANTETQSVRLIIIITRVDAAPPLVASFGLYWDPYPYNVTNKESMQHCDYF